MKKLFTISEMADLYGLNFRTLRHYDDIGLLKPGYVNPNTGYRYYTTEQFEIMNAILYLRELRVPTSEIKEILEKRSVSRMQELLYRQLERSRSELEELKNIEGKILNQLKRLNYATNASLGHITEEHMPERKIAVLMREFTKEDDIEYPLREVAGKNAKNFVIFLGKVGMMLSESNLAQERFDVYSGIFILLDPEDEYSGTITSLPESDYLILRYRGGHADADIYYLTLLSYAANKKLRINGPALELSLMDYVLDENSENDVMEIQLPILRS